jgi:hypothetical protein
MARARRTGRRPGATTCSLRLDKVVARSYAEWCGVIDVLLAAGLVLLW